jgi:hypothetical protein
LRRFYASILVLQQLERPDMIERRAIERVQLDRLALLSLGGIPGVHPCVVKNLSRGGAKLCSHGFHFFAKDFQISFNGFRSNIRCHIVWRRGDECGVVFSSKQSFPQGAIQRNPSSASP